MHKTDMTISEEHIAFYLQIGMTITQWAMVENNLFNVVASCFDEKEYRTIGIGFFSIENFRSKLKYSDRVIRDYFQNNKREELLNSWSILHKRLDRCSKSRNDIAHRWLCVYPDNICGRRYALLPWIRNNEPKKKSSPKKPQSDSLCVRDIIQIRYEFHALNISLVNFAQLLQGYPERFPKSSEKVMTPPPLRRLSEDIHELLGYKR